MRQWEKIVRSYDGGSREGNGLFVATAALCEFFPKCPANVGFAQKRPDEITASALNWSEGAVRSRKRNANG